MSTRLVAMDRSYLKIQLLNSSVPEFRELVDVEMHFQGRKPVAV